MQVGDPRRDPVAERALPRPDLERHVAGIEVGVANDRLQQVGVGEEVLAQPHHLEHLRRVRLDDSLQRLVPDAALGGKPLGDLDHVRGLVGLSAHRLRRQEGRVGLDQEQLLGDEARRLAQGVGLGIGDVAGERAVPAALGGLPDPLRWRGAAVEDHRHALGLGGQRGEGVGQCLVAARGIAHVDHHRQAGAPGDRDLGLERGSLLGARGAVAVVVEAGLADRHHALVRGQRLDLGRRSAIEAGGGVRVTSDAGEHLLVRPGRGDRLAVGGLVHAHGEDATDPDLARGRRPGPRRRARRRTDARACRPRPPV